MSWMDEIAKEHRDSSPRVAEEQRRLIAQRETKAAVAHEVGQQLYLIGEAIRLSGAPPIKAAATKDNRYPKKELMGWRIAAEGHRMLFVGEDYKLYVASVWENPERGIGWKGECRKPPNEEVLSILFPGYPGLTYFLKDSAGVIQMHAPFYDGGGYYDKPLDQCLSEFVHRALGLGVWAGNHWSEGLT